MKKVLHIVESFGGGVFSFLVDLINGIDESYEIVIAYSKRLQTPDDFKSYFNDKVKFIEVENFARSINPIKDLKAFGEIKRIIKQEKPDIVHLHSSKAGFLGRFACNGRNVKVLYNPHGFSFLMKDSTKLKRMIYWLIEKVAAFRKCQIIGCSQGEYEEARKLSKNSICINNGINIEKIKEQTKDLNEKQIDFDNLKVCTVGRIVFPKNPKMFNKIAEEFPNFKFTWIGDGEMRDTLTSENITITGWSEKPDVLKFLNENDVFILASLWEGLPISLLEAMYMKKVCIVSNCIGNRDVIKDGENGFIIKDKNYIEIIKNLNNDIYDKIANNAQKNVLETFNTDVMIGEYKKINEEL